MQQTTFTTTRTGWSGAEAVVAGQRLNLWITGALVSLYTASVLLVGEKYSSSLPNYALIAMTCIFLLEMLRFRLPLTYPVPLLWFTLFLCYVSMQMIWAPSPAAMFRSLAVILILAMVLVNYDVVTGRGSLIEYAFCLCVLFTFAYNLVSGETPIDGRIGSTLVNPNLYAQVLLFGCFFAMRRTLLDGLKRTIKWREGLLLLVFFGLSIWGILYLAGSRKGMLLILVACVAFLVYWVWLQPIEKRMLLSIVALAVLAGVVYVLYRTPLFARVVNISNLFSGQGQVDNALLVRDSMLHDAYHLWLQKPFTGWGLDQFKVVSGWDMYAHDNYLELLADEGIIGCLIYLMIYLSTFVSLIRSLWRSRDQLLSAEIVWALMVLAMMAAWDFAAVSYYSKIQWLMLSVVIAVSVKARRRLRETPAALPAAPPVGPPAQDQR